MNKTIRRWVNKIVRWYLRDPFPFWIPILDNPDHYLELLRRKYEWEEESRKQTLRYTIIGNRAGLIAISALVARWPDTTRLIHLLVPSARFYMLGVTSSGVAVTSARISHRKQMVNLAWRAN